jgi:hypothetical protein
MDNLQLIPSLQAIGRQYALTSIRPEHFWPRAHSSAVNLANG